MDILQAIVLGIVQGLTEFLPISSSAHLIIIPWLADWEPFGLAFDVALHLGTLTSVLIYFRHDLINIISHTLADWRTILARRVPEDPYSRQGLFIALGTIPAAIVGFLWEDTIDNLFHEDPVSHSSLVAIAILLMLVGLLLGYADHRLTQRESGSNSRLLPLSHKGRGARGEGAPPTTDHRPPTPDAPDLNPGPRSPDPDTPDLPNLPQALIIGLAQTFALIPGVSRSGATITAGLFIGLSRPAAARFSFLLGVPVIFGAGVNQMYELTQNTSQFQVGIFIAGILSAAIVGYLAIAGLLRFLQTRTVAIFVIYRLALGLTLLTILALGLN